jgi:hypothetical protein
MSAEDGGEERKIRFVLVNNKHEYHRKMQISKGCKQQNVNHNGVQLSNISIILVVHGMVLLELLGVL